MLKALNIIISIDLKKGFYRHAIPPARNAIHNWRALELTLLRQRHTRSATELESPSDLSPAGYLARQLLSVFNGDWRNQFVERYCLSPMETVEGCKDTMMSLLSCILIDALAERIPSTHRWHTIAPTLEAQCLGLLLHGILRRVSDLVGGSYNQAAALDLEQDAPENSQEAWKIYRAKKDKRSQQFLSSIEADITLSMACIASEPADHVMSRLQSLDHSGPRVWALAFDLFPIEGTWGRISSSLNLYYR
jgi:hypothetical protein